VHTAKSETRMRWEAELASACAFYSPTLPHFDTVKTIIDSWLDQKEALLQFINGEMHARGETLEIGFSDSEEINGIAVSDPVFPYVRLSLGIFPKALALTNRAHVARILGAHDPAAADVFGAGPPSSAPGMERWSMGNPSIGMLVTGLGSAYPDTLNSVKDCASLALLHEVAHTQEPFPNPVDETEFRAMEACADEGSGYLFVRALQNQQNRKGCIDETIILDRLADASFFLSAMIYWASRDAGHVSNYHHPWTRMRCFFRGACFALFGADIPRWKSAYRRVYDRQCEYCIALAVFTPDELWFWREHEALNADWHRFLTSTLPKMTTMRGGISRASLLTPVTQGMHFCTG
jgi:hypothetical protein